MGSEYEFVLDLANLTNVNNSTTDLLPMLRQLRYLDLFVQDDTLVDYVVLEVTSCQCQPDMVVARTGVPCGEVVSFLPPAFADNCDETPTVVCVPAPGSFFPLGTTIVTCTATDDAGNRGYCTFNVTVSDMPSVLTIELSGNNVVISWPITCAPGTLEQTSILPAVSWSPVMANVVTVGNRYQVTLPATTVQRYFRLRQ